MPIITHPTRRKLLQGAGGIVITFALGGIAEGGEPRGAPVAERGNTESVTGALHC